MNSDFFALAGIGALLAVAPSAFAGVNMVGRATQNEGFCAVPAREKVVVDAQYGEWDLTGTIESFGDVSIRDVFSVKTSAMWDRENLYFLFRWRDPTPLNSRIDPVVEPNLGWRADAEQLRMTVGGRNFWITFWSHLDKTSACMLEEIHLDNGVMKTDMRELSFGQELKSGIESRYAKAEDGAGFVHEVKVPWRALGMDAEAVRPGFMLRCGLEFLWGALDGRSFPLHRYEDNFQPGMMEHSGFFCSRPQVWGDLTLVDKPLSSVRSYVPDGEQLQGRILIPIGPVESEKKVSVVVEDEAGNRIRALAGAVAPQEIRWDGLDDSGSPVQPGTYVAKAIVASPIHAVYRGSFYNPGDPPWRTADGRGGWCSDHEPVMRIVRCGEKMILASAFTEGGFGTVCVDLEGRKQWGELVGCGAGGLVAATDDTVYLVPSFRPHNGRKLLKLSAKTGEYVMTDVSETNGLSVAWSNPPPPEWLKGAVAREIADAAQDACGRWWVAERGNHPRRISVWDGTSRVKVREFIGNAPYQCSQTWLHNTDPSRAYAEGNEFRLCGDGTARYLGTVWERRPGGDTVGPAEESNNCNGEVFYSDVSGARHEYLFAGGSVDHGHLARYFIRNADGSWRPCAGIFNVAYLQRLYGDTSPMESKWERVVTIERRAMAPFEDCDPADVLFWTDGNCDGRVQRGECEIVKAVTPTRWAESAEKQTRAMNGKPGVPFYGVGWYRRCDKRDLSFFASASGKGGIWRVRPVGFTADGAPVLKPSSYIRLAESGQWCVRETCPVPESETVMAFAEYRPDLKTPMENWIIGFDGRDGRLLWKYPNKFFHVPGSHSAPMPRQGLVIGALRFMGAIPPRDGRPGVAMIRGNHGMDYFLTDTGVFLGSVFTDQRIPTAPLPQHESDLIGVCVDRFTNGPEPFSGWFGRHDDGVVRATVSLAHQAPGIVTIEGLDDFSVRPPVRFRVSDGDLAAKEATAEPSTFDSLEIGNDESSARRYPLLREGLEDRAEVRCWRGSGILNVRFDLSDASPWKNGANDPALIFKGGDCVDVQLNGVRFLGGRFKGEDRVCVMIEDDKVAGKLRESIARPSEYEYYSPVMTLRFAHVGLCDDVRLHASESGKTVVMSIPERLIPDAGSLVGDIGVIFSDSTGQRNTSRIYLFNHDTGLVSDIPGEAKLQKKHWREWK